MGCGASRRHDAAAVGAHSPVPEPMSAGAPAPAPADDVALDPPASTATRRTSRRIAQDVLAPEPATDALAPRKASLTTQRADELASVGAGGRKGVSFALKEPSSDDLTGALADTAETKRAPKGAAEAADVFADASVFEQVSDGSDDEAGRTGSSLLDSTLSVGAGSRARNSSLSLSLASDTVWFASSLAQAAQRRGLSHARRQLLAAQQAPHSPSRMQRRTFEPLARSAQLSGAEDDAIAIEVGASGSWSAGSFGRAARRGSGGLDGQCAALNASAASPAAAGAPHEGPERAAGRSGGAASDLYRSPQASLCSTPSGPMDATPRGGSSPAAAAAACGAGSGDSPPATPSQAQGRQAKLRKGRPSLQVQVAPAPSAVCSPSPGQRALRASGFGACCGCSPALGAYGALGGGLGGLERSNSLGGAADFAALGLLQPQLASQYSNSLLHRSRRESSNSALLRAGPACASGSDAGWGQPGAALPARAGTPPGSARFKRDGTPAADTPPARWSNSGGQGSGLSSRPDDESDGGDGAGSRSGGGGGGEAQGRRLLLRSASMPDLLATGGAPLLDAELDDGLVEAVPAAPLTRGPQTAARGRKAGQPGGGRWGGLAQEVGETFEAVTGRDELGNRYINQYRILKALGKGAQGKVYLCVDMATSRPAAVKVIRKPRGVSLAPAAQPGGGGGFFAGGSSRAAAEAAESAAAAEGSNRLLNAISTEVAIMKKLSHENIVALYEVIDDPSADKIFIVMEYVGRGPCISLQPKAMTCEPLPAETARAYFRDVLSGLECMHRHSIAHRDIKPDNLLKMSDGRIKIADFGVSDMLNGLDETTATLAGTPAFLAPEVCGLQRARGRVPRGSQPPPSAAAGCQPHVPSRHSAAAAGAAAAGGGERALASASAGNSAVHSHAESCVGSGRGGTHEHSRAGSSRCGGGCGHSTLRSTLNADSRAADVLFSPFRADVWALGVTLYVFCFGRLPFMGSSAAQVTQAVLTAPVPFPPSPVPDPRLVRLLLRMLDKFPANRPSALELMSDAWVTDDGRQPLYPSTDGAASELLELTEAEIRGAITAIKPHFPWLVLKLKLMLVRKVQRVRARLAEQQAETRAQPEEGAPPPGSGGGGSGARDGRRSGGAAQAEGGAASGYARLIFSRAEPLAAQPEAGGERGARDAPAARQTARHASAPDGSAAAAARLLAFGAAGRGVGAGVGGPALEATVSARRTVQAAAASFVSGDGGQPDCAVGGEAVDDRPRSAGRQSAASGGGGSGVARALQQPTEEAAGQLPATELASGAAQGTGTIHGTPQLPQPTLPQQPLPQQTQQTCARAELSAAAAAPAGAGSPGSLRRTSCRTWHGALAEGVAGSPEGARADSAASPLHPSWQAGGGVTRTRATRATRRSTGGRGGACQHAGGSSGGGRGGHGAAGTLAPAPPLPRHAHLRPASGAGGGSARSSSNDDDEDEDDAGRLLGRGADAAAHLRPGSSVRTSTVSVDSAMDDGSGAELTVVTSLDAILPTPQGAVPFRQKQRSQSEGQTGRRDALRAALAPAPADGALAPASAAHHAAPAASGTMSWSVDCATCRGGLDEQEDRFDLTEDGFAGMRAAYIGVYDGHSGARAAECLVELLSDSVARQLQQRLLQLPSAPSQPSALPPGAGDVPRAPDGVQPPALPAASLARALEGALLAAYAQADALFTSMALAALAGGAPLDAAEERGGLAAGAAQTGTAGTIGDGAAPLPAGASGSGACGGGSGGGDGGIALNPRGGGRATADEAAAAADGDGVGEGIAAHPSTESLRAEQLVRAGAESRQLKKEWLCGSTATSVVIASGVLVVAHVGDSIALLVRDGLPIELTPPHKPGVPAELERITAAGGWVTGRTRHGGRVNGVLAVSRAFGDVEYKALKESAWVRSFADDLVVARPDVLSTVLTPSDECIVVASDGLWDALTYEEVAAECAAWRAAHGGSVAGLPQMLARRAADRNVQDNITVVVAGFEHSPSTSQ